MITDRKLFILEMDNNIIKSDRLIIPIYINEKIVLDMLAIIEDGFSTVSQVNYTEHKESKSKFLLL